MRSVVQRRSYGSVKVFWLNRDAALRALRKAASRLVSEREDVAAVYLFGSLAEGRAVPGSDADVLVLLERSGRRWVERSLDFQHYFDDCGLPVELFCYTREEAETVPLGRRAVRDGLRLAGRG